MNIQAETHKYLYLREQLLAQFPDLAEDEQALLDTLEGASTLNEAVVAVYDSARNDELMIEAIKARIGELKERADRLDARADAKRHAACNAMAEAGLKKIEAPTVTLSLRNVAPSVVIVSEAEIPDDYMREKVTKSVDKALVKQALQDGYFVPGAHLSNGGVTLAARVK